MQLNKIYNMDCMEGMKGIPDGSVDMILCDLPYGQTKNKWDSIIPLGPLWKEYRRVIKKNGAIVLFADGMFLADLMTSNRKEWRYNLVWDKVLTSGFLNANRMPLRQHEYICVFYRSLPTYNPQKKKGAKNHSKGQKKEFRNQNYGAYRIVDNAEQQGDLKLPTSIIRYQKPHPSKSLHPTEKPVELFEYLIRTYTNPGETVLDNCIGSGTTAVASIRTLRQFIGFETSEEYCQIADQRIQDEYAQPVQLKLQEV